MTDVEMVFPTGVGVILLTSFTPAEIVCIPHRCGGDPVA